MGEKRETQGAGAAHPCHSVPKAGFRLAQIGGAAIRQLLPLDVSPERFHRIEIGRVAREPFHAQPVPLGRLPKCGGSWKRGAKRDPGSPSTPPEELARQDWLPLSP